ncbi:MAG: sigma 54-interacting transcriptional regulator [Myxococcales bacterium]|nr:sigma 54-interacting transcriptional regulator [Myxococcales bacterium]
MSSHDRDTTQDIRSIDPPGDDERFVLVFFQRDGSQFGARRVPVGVKPLVVGRAADADVVIDDRSLSRRHARLEVREGRLWVEDLGSRNGITVNGEALDDARALDVGDALALGRIDLEIRGPARGDGGAGGDDATALAGHDAFRQALERELVRARHLGRPLSLLLVKAARAGGRLRRAAWQAELASACSPIDMAALYSRAVVELLLPEADEDTAAARAEQLMQQASDPLCVAICSAARVDSADAMLERALAALTRGSESQPLVRVSREKSARLSQPYRAISAASARPVGGEPERPIPELTSRQRKLASADVPMLLFGETGAGKEVMARRIHALGARSDGPFVVLDCGAVPETLMESTLFGTVEGVFTGAQDRPGFFARADGGTLMLDEIGELPLALQPALLRVLDGYGFTRIGGSVIERPNVRVLAATHRDLRKMVEQGGFREDLLQRLGGTIELTPLRRYPRADFEQLARRFVVKAARAHDAEARDIDPAALDLLQHHRWPGNVRELKNELERAVIIAEGDKITVDDLSERIVSAPADSAAAPKGEGRFWDEVRRLQVELIRGALQRNGGNRSEAARDLQLSRRTLTYMLSKYNIA